MAPRRAAVLRDHAASLHDHLVAMTDGLLDKAALSSLTTRLIARHAGVSDGVLYNHFGDKGELLMAALLRRYRRLLEAFEAATPEPGQGSVEVNLRVLARGLRDLEASALHLGAGLLADHALLERFWAEIHHQPFGLERLRRPVARYLEAERQVGRLDRDIDVESAVTLVFGACAMSALTVRLDPGADGAAVDRQLDATIATLLRGFGPAG